ncbi:LapA family protein [Marinisporobacter balticus]|uniref:Putative integral membrane protein n=1 Tax=Marinisporobacter balticus TaxID=2018667 RepID=A0A4R2KJU5_9FIRM|nr:LapA family protein [Marinisporobacter balticus]TCO72707.1 putative integral membrane protein [Marinisporobacter balticus]
MQIWFIFSLVFALIVALFAVLNSDVVTINLLFSKYQLSQSVVILISATFGALIASFISVFSKIKGSLKTRELKNSIKQLESKVNELEDHNKTYALENPIKEETTLNEPLDFEKKA